MKKKNELKRIKKKNQEVSEFDFLICPNCGEQEVGKYCPSCGQSNKDYNKPVKEILGDLLDSINLDIRMINTLIPFFTKPGYLTEEYFNGRRKRYVPPMRMYMFVSIVFFFLVQYTSSDESKDNIIKVDDTEQTASRIKFDAHPEQIDSIENNDSIKKNTNITFNNFDKENIEKYKQEALDDTTVTEWEKQVVIGGLNAVDKKDLFFDKFLKNVSYVLFLLMPFFGLILALILWKSRMLYVKHLIFSINFHSFIFGLSSIVMALGLILPDSVSGYVLYLWWGIPLYLMFGIKRFYQRKYVGAFFKMLGSLFLYFFVISIVIVLILVFTAKGFYNI